jgi:hypothetical protein
VVVVCRAHARAARISSSPTCVHHNTCACMHACMHAHTTNSPSAHGCCGARCTTPQHRTLTCVAGPCPSCGAETGCCWGRSPRATGTYMAASDNTRQAVCVCGGGGGPPTHPNTHHVPRVRGAAAAHSSKLPASMHAHAHALRPLSHACMHACMHAPRQRSTLHSRGAAQVDARHADRFRRQVSPQVPHLQPAGTGATQQGLAGCKACDAGDITVAGAGVWRVSPHVGPRAVQLAHALHSPTAVPRWWVSPRAPCLVGALHCSAAASAAGRRVAAGGARRMLAAPAALPRRLV